MYGEDERDDEMLVDQEGVSAVKGDRAYGIEGLVNIEGMCDATTIGSIEGMGGVSAETEKEEG